jgi:hypothetical protein
MIEKKSLLFALPSVLFQRRYGLQRYPSSRNEETGGYLKSALKIFLRSLLTVAFLSFLLNVPPMSGIFNRNQAFARDGSRGGRGPDRYSPKTGSLATRDERRELKRDTADERRDLRKDTTDERREIKRERKELQKDTADERRDFRKDTYDERLEIKRERKKLQKNTADERREIKKERRDLRKDTTDERRDFREDVREDR